MKFYFKHTRKPKEPIILAILREEKANWLDSPREKKCWDKVFKNNDAANYCKLWSSVFFLQIFTKFQPEKNDFN
jgi:hypothetical protein